MPGRPLLFLLALVLCPADSSAEASGRPGTRGLEAPSLAGPWPFWVELAPAFSGRNNADGVGETVRVTLSGPALESGAPPALAFLALER